MGCMEVSYLLAPHGPGVNAGQQAAGLVAPWPAVPSESKQAHLPYSCTPSPRPLLLFSVLLDSLIPNHVYKVWEPRVRAWLLQRLSQA